MASEILIHRDWPGLQVSYSLSLRYWLQEGFPANRGTVVTLHGYQDNALSMVRRLKWLDTQLPFRVLALNAPFPVPIWTKSGFIEAYSWYFRDSKENVVIVDPSETAARVSAAILQLVGDSPLVFVGFSQGAYLAPLVAKILLEQRAQVRAIFGLGCGYPARLYEDLPKIPIYGIHGDQDDIVPLEPSQGEHAHLLECAFPGEFFTIAGLPHRVDPQMDTIMRPFIASLLDC